MGYFEEGQSGSVKNNTTRREVRRGAAAETPRSPSRRVVLFFELPLWASLKYPIFFRIPPLFLFISVC